MERCKNCGELVSERDGTRGATIWVACSKCGVKGCAKCIKKGRCVRHPRPTPQPGQSGGVAITSGDVNG